MQKAKIFGLSGLRPVNAIKLALCWTILFIPLLVLINPARIAAATSSTLNFQARLLQTGGSLVPDGTYNIEFKIFDASSSSGSSQGSCAGDSNCLWVETRTGGNKVTVANGYFSVNLASVTAFASTINWDQEMWLTMNIGGSGAPSWDGEMTPRIKLTAVPYAFKAGTALGVASNNTSTASTNSANVSVVSGNATGSSSNSGNLTLDVGTATGTAGTISIGTANTSGLTIGRTGVTTTNSGALTVAQLLTGQLGLTVSGATASLNASSNFATNINTGTSTGTVTIGGGLGALVIDSTAFDVSSGGALSGITGYSQASGNFAQSGSGTFSTGTGAISLNGDTTIAAAKILATAKGTDFSTTGTSNDVSIPGSLIRLTGASAQTITGIAGGVDGRILTLVNAAGQTATISNNSGSSSAANRIITGTGGDISLLAGASISLVYDSGASLWRIVGSAGASGTFANVALSNLSGVAINTSLLANGDNTLDLGSSAFSWRTLYADTSVLTPELDTAAAGALGIGNTTATSVSICNSAACDTITVGSNADADSITIGDSLDTVAINGGTTITGTTGVVGILNVNVSANNATNINTGTSTGVVTIGGGSGTFSLQTTNIDISTAGAISGITDYSQASGNFSISGAGTFGTGTGAISLNGDTTIAAGKNLALASGSGTIVQTFTGTTTTASTITANSLTTGSALNVTSSNNSAANTAWTGTVINVTNAQASTAVSSGSIAGFKVNFTQNTAVGGNTETAASFNITQNDSSTTDSSVASILDLANNDTATGNQITVTDGLKITGTNITNGINLSGTFGTNLITSSNFTVTQAGAITAVGVNSGSGLIQGTGGATIAGTTQINVSGTANTTIGNTAGGTITVGATSGSDLVLQDAQWGVTGAGAATFASVDAGSGTIQTTGSVLGNNIDRTSAGALAIGNTTATSVSVCNSAACDTITVGSNADADSITIGDSLDTVGINGTTTVTGGTTVVGQLDVNVNANNAVNIDTGTSTGLVTIGGGSGTFSLQTTNIDISSAGAISGVTGYTQASGNFSITGTGTFGTGTGAISLNGDTTIAAAKILATAKGTDYSTTGTSNDVSIPGSLIRLTGASAQTITGIAGGVDGRMLTIVNAASQSATISNNSGSSAAANRIITGTGGDITLPAGASVTMIYDSGASLWRTTAAVANAGANQQLSNLSGTVAVNLSLIAGSDNTLDLGSSSFGWRSLYADTSVLTPAVDTATAGTLTIGNTTATAVSICNSSACDTITIGSNADADSITVGDSLDTLSINGTATVNGATTFAASGTALTVTNQADFDSYIAVGSGGNVNPIAALNVNHSFGAAVDCGASGCYAVIADSKNNSSAGAGNFAVGLLGRVTNDGGTLATANGIRIANAVVNAGSITNNYGILVKAQTAGGTDYGIAIETASDYSLVLGADANNTTANAGLFFGSSKDTNLYRKNTDILRTDDSMEIGGATLTFDTDTAHTIKVADQDTAATAGTALTVQAGLGNTSGAGGATTIQGGEGGTTGTGGALNLYGGAGGATSGVGGAVTIQAGTATSGNGAAVTIAASNAAGGSTTGGNLSLSSGNGNQAAAISGTVTLQSGNIGGDNATRSSLLFSYAAAFTQDSSDVTLSAGSGLTTGTGGNVSITAGNGGSTSGVGGAISLTSGAGVAGNSAGGELQLFTGNGSGTQAGGLIRLQAGVGGSTGVGGAISLLSGQGGGTSGVGGAISITTGDGVAGNSAGGAISLTSGNGAGTQAGGAISMQGGTGGATGTGGGITIQGGIGGSSSGNGGLVTISGGLNNAGTGRNLVVISTPAFSTSSTETCGTNCTITQSKIDSFGAVLVNSTAASLVVTVPDPSITTAGKTVYITGVDNTNDFTLRLNGGGTQIDISMRENTTATLIWNGSDWTAAGASSSTDLQAAYNNTLTSAGGAELVLNASGGAADGLTIRNNATTPITGALLEVQTSIGSNLLSVNNNATEYANNGGSESSTYTMWTAAPAGGTVTRTTTAGNYATGQAATSIATTTTIATGGRNTLSTTLTPNLKYQVSFTARAATTSFSTLSTTYSLDGSTTVRHCVTGNAYYSTGTASQSGTTITGVGTTFTSAMVGSVIVFNDGNTAYISAYVSGTQLTAASSQTVSSQSFGIYLFAYTVNYGVWSRISCTFTAPSSGITSSNAIYFRQQDSGTARTFYVDNLSVTVNAAVNHAVDGSVDDSTNFATNYTAFGASVTVARDTSVIYDTSASASVITPASTDRGITNNLRITPSVSTQYLIAFYAKLSSGTFTDIRVRYSRDGGTSFVSCDDYSTRTLSTSAWTKITCILTTDSTTATNADLIIDQPTATARTFYVDAITMTLNTNNSSNVQVGGANKGGPLTLLTLDRASAAPIAENNDAYLGSMYYDTATGRIQCYEADGWGACGASPDNVVNLNPEYSGAVLNGTGVGTMTADVCGNGGGLSVNTSLCASGEARNFYKWTSPQATQQTYSIYVTYQLPSTFKNFSSDDTVQLTARADSTSNAAVTYELYKSQSGSITQCGSGETTVVTSANTWQTVGINGNESTSCSFSTSSASAFIIFKINVKANSNANAYVGTLSFTTTGT